MVELIMYRGERMVDDGEIDDPPGCLVKVASDMYLHFVGVAVQSSTRMAVGSVWQMMCCLEAIAPRQLKLLRHGRPTSLWVCRLSRQSGCSRQ